MRLGLAFFPNIYNEDWFCFADEAAKVHSRCDLACDYCYVYHAADPMRGELIAAIEVAVMLTIIGTALFGSHALSERAFRLLRWLVNRPEPPGPASDRGRQASSLPSERLTSQTAGGARANDRVGASRLPQPQR